MLKQAKLLFLLIGFIGLSAVAEEIFVVYQPSAQSEVFRVASEFGYRVQRVTFNGAYIEIPKQDAFYTDFLLRVFENPEVVSVYRNQDSVDSRLQFALPFSLNAEAVSHILERLESLGAHVTKINESEALVDMRVPQKSLARVQLEINLISSELKSPSQPQYMKRPYLNCFNFFRSSI